MRICGIICEYNPFHNGHAYLLEQAKSLSGCDALVCIMSGPFTQRGDIAILDKYTRAKHAVAAGADAVIELPAVFSTAPAELFAKGAVKLLCSLPDFSALAFGCENPDKQSILDAASLTSAENHGFKNSLRYYLKKGVSFTRAKTQAIASTGNPKTAQFLSSPNNILSVEYQKALLLFGSSAEILPVQRTGSDHSSDKIAKNFSSATAIRCAIREKNWRAVKKNVPAFVARDLIDAISPDTFHKIALFSAIKTSSDQMKKIMDCSEGLENRIKAFAKNTHDYDYFIAKVTTKRYISSRIRRILTAAALDITEDIVRKAVRSNLYLKILAVNKRRADEILPILKRSSFPCITRRSDLALLSKQADEIYAVDTRASDIFNLAADIVPPEAQMRFIDPNFL